MIKMNEKRKLIEFVKILNHFKMRSSQMREQGVEKKEFAVNEFGKYIHSNSIEYFDDVVFFFSADFHKKSIKKYTFSSIDLL